MIAFEKVTFYAKKPDDDGVRHIFPVDSLASHETAKSWATVQDSHWENGRRVYGETHEPDVFEYENKGFDNVTIVDLYHRGNGGRAYQIVIEIGEDKFRMDLREDTMMEAFKYKGIQAGGRLNGTYCLVRDGKETKLILEGTERHKNALEEFKRRQQFNKPIKKSELKIGCKYKADGGDTAIYLGDIYTADVDHDIKLGKPYKVMLWLDAYNIADFQKVIEDQDSIEEFAEKISWRIRIKKSHSFKMEVEQVLNNDDIETYINIINKVGKCLYDKLMARDWISLNADYEMERAIGFYKLSKLKTDKKQLKMIQEDIDIIEKKRGLHASRLNSRWW